MNQPSKLETLDDLLAQAEHYANHSMRNIGRLPATLFLIGADGPLMLMPESLADDGAKDAFADNARLMCIAHAATSVVTALEAWVKFAKPDEKFDETEAPFGERDRAAILGPRFAVHPDPELAAGANGTRRSKILRFLLRR